MHNYNLTLIINRMPWTLRMTLLIAGLTGFCMIYNTIRIYWYSKQTGLHSPKNYWILVGGLTILIFAYPLSAWVINAATGNFSLYWYPVWLISIFWYGFIFNTVLLSWILAADIINLTVTYLLRVKRPQFQTLLGLGVLVITAAVFVYTSAKTIYDTNRIKVEQFTFEHPAVASGELDPLRIVHISEMHADRYTSPEKISRYMKKVEEQNPDIVIFTGDLISSGLDYVEAASNALASVNPPLGVYFVMGDHDYWSGQDEITEILESRGVNVIRDANEWIELNGRTLKITGITEVYSTSINRDLLRELLDERRDEQVSILFSHQAPDEIIEMAADAGVDIMLAGHTHGGQIRIPIFFKKFTAANLETDYVNSYWQKNGMILNINSGLGFTLAPLRYNAPAGVSVIDIK